MKDTFCPLAWTSFGMTPLGRVRVCGRSLSDFRNPHLNDMPIEEAWNSDYYKQMRLDMLTGKQNRNCEKCYIQEHFRGVSKRLEECQRYFFSKKEAERITNKDGSITAPPWHIDVRVGNICNLKCIHCFPGNSSKWYEDQILLNKYENTEEIKHHNGWISETGKVWTYIKENIHSIKKLSFLGGEPFASHPHNQFLKWMIKNNHTHLSLKYITNGTLMTQGLINQLKKFKYVNLGISLDDLGERVEFLRYPIKWRRLKSNLTALNQSGFNLFFNWTAYNTNIFTLPETYNYCQTHFSNIHFRLADFVTKPSHLSIQNLPNGFKKKVTEKLESMNISNIGFYINFMNEKSLWDSHNEVLYNYLEDLDQARGTNWKKVLPEIAELWKKQ